MVFGTIEQAIADIRDGKFVIVADDEKHAVRPHQRADHATRTLERVELVVDFRRLDFDFAEILWSLRK